MNDLTRAIEVLKQAREILTARLAERVVDGYEEILDDAAGLSFAGAIESVHDQLGQRLGNVTALLAHLQAFDEAGAGEITGDRPFLEGSTEVDRVEPAPGEHPAEEGGPDRVIHEVVFHETDFRTLDLIPHEVEGGLLSAGDGCADEAAGSQ